MNEKDGLEQEFLLELQAREFLQWKQSLTDETTINWVEALVEQIELNIDEIDQLQAEIESKEFYQRFFGIFILFLFLCFSINLLKWLIFS